MNPNPRSSNQKNLPISLDKLSITFNILTIMYYPTYTFNHLLPQSEVPLFLPLPLTLPIPQENHMHCTTQKQDIKILTNLGRIELHYIWIETKNKTQLLAFPSFWRPWDRSRQACSLSKFRHWIDNILKLCLREKLYKVSVRVRLKYASQNAYVQIL